MITYWRKWERSQIEGIQEEIEEHEIELMKSVIFLLGTDWHHFCQHAID